MSRQGPFDQLKTLLTGITPGNTPIDLTIGSPQHAPPAFVAEVIAKNAAGFMGYPPIDGTKNFQRATHDWVDRRYGLNGWMREAGGILPLNGSREGLFCSGVTARDITGKSNPAMLFANPFYSTYPAAAHGFAAEEVPLNARPGSVLPDWSDVPQDTLDRAISYTLASPANPDGLVLSMADWHELFDKAEKHNFMIFADECYSEIYRETHGPPVGALEAAKERPEMIERIFAFNSLSKRSNLAGMRVGTVMGSKANIKAMRDYRNTVAPQVASPLQEAAAAVYDDEAHVIENRRLYDEKYEAAAEALDPVFADHTPPGGFFLYLPVGGDETEAAKMLWSETGVKAVPGSYLALTPKGGSNPGRGYLRFALVADAAVTREALGRVRDVFAERAGHGRVAFENVGGGA
ncbi:MAG: aminotransferase class I/II-fold pyridoxal phosphate-dependent enzyme [Pseudomonadota bacterium]